MMPLQPVQTGQPLTLAVMVPCFSPLLLIILIPALWNIRFISSGVAVVAKSTSSGRFPDSRSRTAPPAILSSCWCFSNTSERTNTLIHILSAVFTLPNLSFWLSLDLSLKQWDDRLQNSFEMCLRLKSVDQAHSMCCHIKMVMIKKNCQLKLEVQNVKDMYSYHSNKTIVLFALWET